MDSELDLASSQLKRGFAYESGLVGLRSGCEVGERLCQGPRELKKPSPGKRITAPMAISSVLPNTLKPGNPGASAAPLCKNAQHVGTPDVTTQAGDVRPGVELCALCYLHLPSRRMLVGGSGTYKSE